MEYKGNKPDKRKDRVPLPPPGGSPRPGKNMAILMVMFLLMTLFFLLLGGTGAKPRESTYTEFLSRVRDAEVGKAKIIERNVEYVLKSDMGNTEEPVLYTTYIPYTDPQLLALLEEHEVVVEGEEPSTNTFLSIMLSMLPWILIIGVIWFIMMRQLQGGSNKAMSFGKSRAREFKPSSTKITFDDVAGVEEAKQELTEIIDFLVSPEKFKKLGARIPKGVMLIGPPGTGKTLLARAVAGEANVPFFSISGSDFVEMFVGVGASRVRDLFEQGKKNAPCILFIDELDAVGRSRGAGYGGGHDEREQTLNQMLVEMDGFEANEGLILLAATNRPDVLDPALLRPGRFDRQVVVDAPDVKGREAILAVHVKNVPVSTDIDLQSVARGTPGFTGADLANMVNEAALIAARSNKRKVGMLEMEEAKDKVLMGPERRSLVISDREKRNTAYHEAGHALLGYILPHADPIHKITIIPRGRALGLTQSLPIDERHTYDKLYLMDQLMLLLGGRVAEEYLGQGNITNGAANDIERATNLARAMVCEWGMSEALGPLSYGQKEQPIFIGKEIARHKDYSERTAELIDTEIKVMISYSLERSRDIILKNRPGLEALAAALLKYEVIDAVELEKIMKTSKVKKLTQKDVEKIIAAKPSAARKRVAVKR